MKSLINMRAGIISGIICLSLISPDRLFGGNAMVKEYKNILINKSQAAEEDWIISLYKNQAFLISKFSSRPGLTSGQRETATIISNKPVLLTDSIRLILIDNILDISLYKSGSNNYTGFIEDKPIFEILIEALKDSDQSVRNRAFSYVLKYAKADMLRSNSVTIKKNIEKYDFNDKELLTGLLDLKPDEKTALLANKETPEIVTARIGNPELQSKFITQFRQASTYKEKYDAAEKLGYIGSPKCAQALIEGLGSDLELRAAYEQVSIRYMIIKTLGRIYPDEPLFTTEINKIAELGDDRYGGIVEITKYLNRISEWSFKQLKIKWSVKPDSFIYKRFLVKKPLSN